MDSSKQNIGENPLEMLFKLMKQNSSVLVMEKETNTEYKGKLFGFDRYINVVLESENGLKYLIKGDCISLIKEASSKE